MAAKTKQYRYDPQTVYVVVQEGGSSGEVYLHPFDHLTDAKRHERACVRASYNVFKIDVINRNELEQYAPHLYRLLALIKNDTHVFSKIQAPVRQEIVKVLKEVEATPHLQDIVEQTVAHLPLS